jgi:hypothetical protein
MQKVTSDEIDLTWRSDLPHENWDMNEAPACYMGDDL